MQRAIGIVFILSVFLGQHLDATGKTPASPIFYKTKTLTSGLTARFISRKDTLAF